MSEWYETEEGGKEWAQACFVIRETAMAQPEYTTYLEVHQRIEVYRASRVAGLCHGEAVKKAIEAPHSELPHIVFEVPNDQER